MVTLTAEDRRNEQGEIDYFCPASHHVYGENVVWRSKGPNRPRYPGCRECRAIYKADYIRREDVKARYRQAAAEQRKQKLPVSEYSDIDGESSGVVTAEESLGVEKRSVPWNLLRPRAEASNIFDEFNDALKYTDVPCRGRASEFTEYRDPRPSREDDAEREGRLPMPSHEQARLMCGGCELLSQCDAFARAEKPDFGIWGANRWLNGKVV